jgi:hypothetical protein
MKTRHPTRAQVIITIDVYDEPFLTVLLWDRQSAHTLTNQLWQHGVLAHVARVEIDPHQPRSK